MSAENSKVKTREEMVTYKKNLLIDVLDKGAVNLREFGTLASALAASDDDGKCFCRGICSCKEVCVSPLTNPGDIVEHDIVNAVEAVLRQKGLLNQ